jgi:hypothetical protein
MGSELNGELIRTLARNPIWREAGLACAAVCFFPLMWLVIEVVYIDRVKKSPSARQRLGFWRTYLAMLSLIAVVVVLAVTWL